MQAASKPTIETEAQSPRERSHPKEITSASEQWPCRGSKRGRALLSSSVVHWLWNPRHAACGWPATFAALVAWALLSAWSLPARAESFVRRLAERALERGIVQEARGDIAQALTSYDEAVRTDVTLGAAALRLGSLRERLGDPTEAELLYTHAISAPDTAADAYYARALLRSTQHQRAQATVDLAESVARSPQPERLRLLGSWYVEARTWPAALAVWRALHAAATASGDAEGAREAQLTVTALSWLASDTDPVLAGASSPDWVRRSLARTARQARGHRQGVRKLTP
jgi:tetratricopeptide (TPR) repeat protein